MGLVLPMLGQGGLWEGVVLPFLIHCVPTLTSVFQNVCKPPEETQRPPTLQEIKQKIDSYNTREKNCLGMKLVRRARPHPRPRPRPRSLGLPCYPSRFWGGPSEAPPLSPGLGACARLRTQAVRDPPPGLQGRMGFRIRSKSVSDSSHFSLWEPA